MPRVIQRRITAIQITSIEILWDNSDQSESSVVDVAPQTLHASPEAGEAAQNMSARQAVSARKRKKRSHLTSSLQSQETLESVSNNSQRSQP